MFVRKCEVECNEYLLRGHNLASEGLKGSIRRTFYFFMSRYSYIKNRFKSLNCKNVGNECVQQQNKKKIFNF